MLRDPALAGNRAWKGFQKEVHIFMTGLLWRVALTVSGTGFDAKGPLVKEREVRVQLSVSRK